MSYLTTPADLAWAALGNQPFSEVVVGWILQPLDPSTGERVSQYVSNDVLFTASDDTPANVGFKNVVREDWKFSRRLAPRARFKGSSDINFGSIKVQNTKSDGVNGDLDDWLDFTWDSAPVQAVIGGKRQSNGQKYTYDLFRTMFEGLVEDVFRRPDGSFEVIFLGRANALKQPILDASDIYKGFGGAVRVVTNETFTTDTASEYLLDPPYSVEMFGRVRAMPPANEVIFWRAAGSVIGGTSDRFLHNGVAGLMRVQNNSGANSLAFATNVADGDEFALGYSVDIEPGGGYRIRAYDPGGETTAVWASMVFEDLANANRFLFSQATDRDQDYEFWEVRFFGNVARTYQQFLDEKDGPIFDPAGRSDLTEVWKFGEGTGTAFFGEKLKGAGVLTQGVFVGSNEGDDPEQFEGSVKDQTKPRAIGYVRDVPLVPVDSQRGTYQWSKNPSDDFLRLKHRGAPLVPKQEITTSTKTVINYDDTEKSLELVAVQEDHLKIATFKRLIPFQLGPPERVGQRIQISGDATRDGNYRVASISDDGLKVFLSAEAKLSIDNSGIGFTTGVLTTGAIVRTHPEDEQYEYDLATSTVTSVFVSDGDLTADVIGETIGSSDSAAGAHKVSDAFEILVGETPDVSRLTFDPDVGLYLPINSTKKLVEALDELALSAFGYWVEERDGSYLLGVYEEPDADDVRATLSGDRLSTLDAANVAEISGNISQISSIRTSSPPWSFPVGYARTWKTLDPSSIVGSVTPSEKIRLSEDFRIATKNNLDTRDDFALSEPHPLIETLVCFRGDAETLAGRFRDILSKKRRWYQVEVAGLLLTSLELHDTIFVQHPESTFGLLAGANARIMSLSETAIQGKFTAEIFT